MRLERAAHISVNQIVFSIPQLRRHFIVDDARLVQALRIVWRQEAKQEVDQLALVLRRSTRLRHVRPEQSGLL